MIKKILFETLQRFDLKDANELQQGVLNKLKSLANSVNTNRSSSIPQGGPTSVITCVGVSDGVARFSAMELLTAENEALSFDQTDIDNALLQVDMSAAYATHQTLVAGGADPGGIYFYAYPKSEDTDSESREFFSLVDNAPTNRVINTRQQSSIEFIANTAATFNVQNSDGFYPIRIGHVATADILTTNSSSPFIPTNFKSASYYDFTYPQIEFDDTSLPNVANNRDNDVGGYSTTRTEGLGFSTPFKKLERQLNRIVSYGVSDSQATTLLGYNARPLKSLQGLTYEIGEVSSSNVKNSNKIKRASATIVYDFTGSSPLVQQVYDNRNEIAEFAVALDYTWCDTNDSDPNTVAPSKNAFSASGGYTSLQRKQIFSRVIVSMANTYQGYHIRNLNVNFITTEAGGPVNNANGFIANTNNNSGTQPNMGAFSYFKLPNDGSAISGDDTVIYSDASLNRIQAAKGMDSTGVPYNKLAAFKLAFNNLFYFSALENSADNKFAVQIQVELEDPNYLS